MSKIEKVKENKGKIIAGSITISGVIAIIVLQGNKIKNLQTIVSDQQDDIELLKDVMSDTVLDTLKETLTRRIRYAEKKLANGLADGVMSQADELLRREEIESYGNQLMKVLEAKKRFVNKD